MQSLTESCWNKCLAATLASRVLHLVDLAAWIAFNASIYIYYKIHSQCSQARLCDKAKMLLFLNIVKDCLSRNNDTTQKNYEMGAHERAL